MERKRFGTIKNNILRRVKCDLELVVQVKSASSGDLINAGHHPINIERHRIKSRQSKLHCNVSLMSCEEWFGDDDDDDPRFRGDMIADHLDTPWEMAFASGAENAPHYLFFRDLLH